MLELVGRYKVQERIGEGAMADVYRAYDPSINRALAVKVLKGEFRENAEYSGRFLREAKAAGALSHPNIVTIYDVGEVDGYSYIVMELLDGRPLTDVMQKEGALDPDVVMEIGVQLADALRYAHAQGVVHRDIKPSNIVLGADGRSIKILDFGIARVTEADALIDENSLKTQIGQVLGTPRYMSPEQALGQAVDGRSDLFSVGAVLYELATGKRAFPGGSAATLALQITQEDPAPIATLAPRTPRGLQFIVTKLLSKKPERRFSDGAQLAAALRKEQAVYGTVLREAAVKPRYLPLQLRLALSLAAVTGLVMLASTALVLSRQQHALEQVAVSSGAAVASFVASNASQSAADNATLPPAQRDWVPVQAFVRVASEDRNVDSMTVIDRDGVVRGASDPALVGRRYAAPGGERPVLNRSDLTVTSLKGEGGKPALRFVEPITYAGHRFGQVDVSLSMAELQSALALSRALMFGLAVLTLLVVGGASYALVRMLAQPIRRLQEALSSAARGDLDFRISHHRRDEFGELFDSFNLFVGVMQERLETVEAVALDTSTPPGPRLSARAPESFTPPETGPFSPLPHLAHPATPVPSQDPEGALEALPEDGEAADGDRTLIGTDALR